MEPRDRGRRTLGAFCRLRQLNALCNSDENRFFIWLEARNRVLQASCDRGAAIRAFQLIEGYDIVTAKRIKTYTLNTNDQLLTPDAYKRAARLILDGWARNLGH